MATPMSNRRLALAGVLLVSAVPAAYPLSSEAAQPAPVPRLPSVTTGGLPQVSISMATLKGMVNPHGIETVYAFQYGTTAAYGGQTSPVSVGSGTAEVKVSQTITGLQPYTTYHCRLVATNAVGTTNGQDVVFTTKKIPLTFKIAGMPDPAVFGSSLSVSGVLSGTGAANHEVVLQADSFPYLGGFESTGDPEMTDGAGNFSFSVAHLLENTEFRVATLETPAVKSPVVVARVAVRVSLSLRSTGRHGFVRMYGKITPAEVGARVGFQLMRSGLKPLTVAGTVAKPASAGTSRFSRIVRIRHGGLYRVFVRVANGRHVSGHSRLLLIH